MNSLSLLAKSLILLGGFLLLFGIVLFLISTTGLKWKPLPGDIFIQRDNFTFIFPLATSLLLSLGLTILFTLLALLFRR